MAKKRYSKPKGSGVMAASRAAASNETVAGDTTEGTSTSTSAPASNSSMRGIQYPTGGELIKQQPGIITDPWGNAYLTRRSRPWPDDEIQIVSEFWEHTLRGYWDMGATSVAEPFGYGEAANQLDASYSYMRQICKLSRKPRLKQDDITSGTMLEYFNIYHFAVSNLVAFRGVFRLLQFSEVFQNMASYLVDRMVRLSRLYARAMVLVVPDFVKADAVLGGSVVMGQRIRTPHVRLWSARELTLYGNADYDATWDQAEVTSTLWDILRSTTLLDTFIDDIESAILALEGNVGNGTTEKNDVLSLKEVFEYIATVEDFKPKYQQGLPPYSSLPGIVVGDQFLNDFYCRGVTYHDTKGVGNDQDILFPSMHMAGLNNMIPIKGWGAYGLADFTLLGGVKFYASVNNLVAGVNYVDVPAIRREMGCDRPLDANESNMTGRVFFVYTREDAEEELGTYSNDLGNATDLKNYLNYEIPSSRHIYAHQLLAAQLTTNMEFRFLDRVPTDYEFWADPDKFGENHAMFIADAMGLPFLG